MLADPEGIVDINMDDISLVLVGDNQPYIIFEDIIEYIRTKSKTLKVIIMTEHINNSLVEKVIQCNCEYLPKPIKTETLLLKVNSVFNVIMLMDNFSRTTAELGKNTLKIIDQ